MTTDELFIKNQTLSHEFSLYLFEHPDIAERIPHDAQVILLPKNDPELCRENMKLSQAQREPKQPVVYVHVDKIKPARSRLVHPELEIIPQ